MYIQVIDPQQQRGSDFNTATTQLNLRCITLNERSQTKYILYDSIYMKFSNRQNYSMVIEVRAMVALEG